MSLKYELDTLEGVDESVAALYEQKGDRFQLKVEGVEDVTGLKSKIAELLDEKKAAQKRAEQEAEARAQAAAEAAAKAGDVEALKKSWQEKLSRRETELAEQIKARDARLHDLTVGSTAQSIASEIAVQGSAGVIARLVRDRLRYDDGKVVVLDAEGKPSALSVDELKKEISEDPALAPLILGSKASGGGAAGAKGGGAAKSLHEMTGAERAALANKDPAAFNKLVEAAKTTGS